MKRKNELGKKAVVGEKDVLHALDGVITSLEGMSGKLGDSQMNYLRIAIDNAVSVACQYRSDFKLFFSRKGG